MSEWKNWELQQFMAFDPPTPPPEGGEAVRIAMEDLASNGRKIRTWRRAGYTGGARFRRGDTLVARITPCLENGKIGYVDMLAEGETGFGTREFLVLRAIEGVSDPRFVFYLAFGREFRDLCEQLMQGSSGRQRVETDELRTCVLRLPDLETQRAIAEVLWQLDDKIDLVTRQNATLEALAQTCFRQWLVERPDRSWETRPLDGIADFLNGLPLQEYPCGAGEPLPVIKIRELHNGYGSYTDLCSADIPEKYVVRPGDVVFSWSGSLTAAIWKYGKGALNQHLFKVTSDRYPKWFYYGWIKHHLREFRFIAESKATTMGHIQREHLTEARVLVPDGAALERMGETMEPLLQRIQHGNLHILTLQKLRDTLLPKLLSGEAVLGRGL